MKFAVASTLILATTSVFAAPAPVAEVKTIERRDSPIVTAITDTISTLQRLVVTDVANINTAVATVQRNIAAAASVVITINANFLEIANGVLTATRALLRATGGALGDIASAAATLTLQELQNLLTAVNNLRAIITALRDAVTVSTTGITTAVSSFVRAQIAALTSLLEPFIDPIETLVEDIVASNPLTVNAEAIQTALDGVEALVTGLVRGV